MVNNDYRLGNWIILHGKTCQITGILKGYFNINDECYEDDKGEFQPVWYGNGGVEGILLTPDVLLKCGFERRVFKGKFIDEDESILRHAHFDFTLDYNQLRWGESGVHVEFVHQLQNLYYSLMKKELPVNIPQPA